MHWVVDKEAQRGVAHWPGDVATMRGGGNDVLQHARRPPPQLVRVYQVALLQRCSSGHKQEGRHTLPLKLIFCHPVGQWPAHLACTHRPHCAGVSDGDSICKDRDSAENATPGFAKREDTHRLRAEQQLLTQRCSHLAAPCRR